ncbi:hypothetical protein MPTK2_2g18960 [Marchantia polymorpha subsp. ruderalis]
MSELSRTAAIARGARLWTRGAAFVLAGSSPERNEGRKAWRRAIFSTMSSDNKGPTCMNLSMGMEFSLGLKEVRDPPRWNNIEGPVSWTRTSLGCGSPGDDKYFGTLHCLHVMWGRTIVRSLWY